MDKLWLKIGVSMEQTFWKHEKSWIEHDGRNKSCKADLFESPGFDDQRINQHGSVSFFFFFWQTEELVV